MVRVNKILVTIIASLSADCLYCGLSVGVSTGKWNYLVEYCEQDDDDEQDDRQHEKHAGTANVRPARPGRRC
jgi:hypothetical protein